MCVSSLLASIRARSCVPQWACCAAAAIGVLHHTHFSSHQQGGMAAPGCSSHSPVAGAQSTEGWLHPALAQCFPESPTCHLLPPQMCAAALPLSHKMAAAVAPQPHPLCTPLHPHCTPHPFGIGHSQGEITLVHTQSFYTIFTVSLPPRSTRRKEGQQAKRGRAPQCARRRRWQKSTKGGGEGTWKLVTKEEPPRGLGLFWWVGWLVVLCVAVW